MPSEMKKILVILSLTFIAAIGLFSLELHMREELEGLGFWAYGFFSPLESSSSWLN